jgi:hypothetical protein
MIIRSLPSDQMRRREVIFGKAFRRIVVLTTKLLEAHNADPDDPQLSETDLAIDAALGAAMAYDALYWTDPAAFSNRGDAYLLAFVVRCAALAVEEEILRVQTDSQAGQIDPIQWPQAPSRGIGFSLVSAV